MQRPIRKIPAALLSQVLLLGLSTLAVFADQGDLLKDKVQPFGAPAYVFKFKPTPGLIDVKVEENGNGRCLSFSLKRMPHYICEEFSLTLAGNDLYFSPVGSRKIGTKIAILANLNPSLKAPQIRALLGADPKMSLGPTQLLRLTAAQRELFAHDPKALLEEMALDYAGFLSGPNKDSAIEAGVSPETFSRQIDLDFGGDADLNGSPVSGKAKRHARSADGKVYYLDENNDPITAEDIFKLHFQELQEELPDALYNHLTAGK